MDPAAAASVEFGRFRVFPLRRELLAAGRPIKLGGRAFDVLLALIEAHGSVVSKDALMARVWPGRVVEENALQVQISALRAAFGPDGELIRTVSGRGYQFAGEIRFLSAGPDEPSGPGTAAVEPGPAMSPTNLPEPASALIGRDDELCEVVSLAVRYRLVTLTGPGGIGKSRLALAVARELLGEFSDGVWLVELAPLSDPGLVPSTVAAAAGTEVGGGAASVERLADALAGKQLLLVLDNCEHVIAAAADLAEAFLRAGPGVRIIATSRESLRAEGEQVYPLQPLSVPPEAAEDDDDAPRYGAVRLFLDRLSAAAPGFALNRSSAAAISEICRRLDGIPLAIELAAARAAALGIEELASRLDDRFHLLTGGRRTAPPRHQTLRATLHWSHEFLPESERKILRRLAIFAGTFSLTAARAVVASADVTPSDVVEGIANLAAKSLVSTSFGSAGTRYLLLNTTRAYAQEKLTESGEFQAVARQHAEHLLNFLEQAGPGEARLAMRERLAEYRHELNDVRAALDWAFSQSGDAHLGVALTAASERLWFGLSLMDECRLRVERALLSLRTDMTGEMRLEMRLSAALGTALYYAKGPCPEVCAAWTDALAMAERLDATEYRLRALWGLCSHHAGIGELRTALAVAQRFAGLPPDQAGRTDRLLGERLLGSTLLFLGDLNDARRHLEHVLGRNPDPMAPSDPETIRFEWGRRSSARGSLVPALWLLGLPDQAIHMAQAYVEEARATDHPVSLCWALYAACPIALAAGDLPAADRFAVMLLEHSTRHAPGFLPALARGLRGELLVKRGDAVSGVQCLHAALGELRAHGFVLRRPALLGALAEGLAAAGQVAESLLTIDEALAQCERSEERWNIAELLRLKGQLLLLEGSEAAPAAAETYFRQALDWARRQGALSWELRSATSLARLLREGGRIGEAREMLSAVYDRFTEGFETADLKAASALLGALRGSAE